MRGTLRGIDKKRFERVSLIVLAIIFLGQVLIDGPIICVDSPSYLEMNFSREPVYPLFLLAFRTLFERMNITGTAYGQPAYLLAVVIVQSLLWIWAIWKLGTYVYRNFNALLGCLAVFFQIGVAFLNRYIAARRSMYSECIMTEALAMPLFLIANIYLWDLFEEYKASTLIKLLLVTVLIASIRKQMLIVLLTWMFVAFVIFLFVRSRRDPGKFLTCLILGVVAFISAIMLDRGYNYAVRGVFAGHTGNSTGAIDTLMYTATPESKALFAKYSDSEEFPHLDELYSEIYDICHENGYMVETSPGFTSREDLAVLNYDWVALVDHYAEVYDHIGFDVMIPSGDAYVAKYFPELDYVHAKIKENAVEKEIMNVLLLDDLKKLFTEEGHAFRVVFAANVLKAFVISNANTSPRILTKVSGIIYLLFLTVFIVCLLRRKDRAARICFIVFAGLAINCVITGSMIFPQPRYMCYSMGLFYLTLCCGILYR